MAQTSLPPSPKKRIRLAPAVRKKLVLDAALAEFSTHGFAAASTEKIAQRAGLSQAGLYAHYKSKDAILEALFSEVLLHDWSQWLSADEAFSEEKVDHLIDCMYAKVEAPDFLAVFRLLITDGLRHAPLISQWYAKVVEPYIASQQNIVNTMVAQKKMQRSILSENFQLAISPLFTGLMMRLLRDGAGAAVAQDMAELRDSHRKMLKELLTPRPEAPAPSGPLPAAATCAPGTR